MIHTSRITEYTLQCDLCGTTETLHTGDCGAYNYNEIIKLFRTEGWSIGKKQLCSNCKTYKKDVERIQCPTCKGVAVIQTEGGKLNDCDVCHGTGYIDLYCGDGR